MRRHYTTMDSLRRTHFLNVARARLQDETLRRCAEKPTGRDVRKEVAHADTTAVSARSTCLSECNPTNIPDFELVRLIR